MVSGWKDIDNIVIKRLINTKEMSILNLSKSTIKKSQTESERQCTVEGFDLVFITLRAFYKIT